MKKFCDFLEEKQFYIEHEILDEDLKKEYEELKIFFGFLKTYFGSLTKNDIKKIKYTTIDATKTFILKYTNRIKILTLNNIENQIEKGVEFLKDYLKYFDAEEIAPVEMKRELPSSTPTRLIDLAYGIR